MLTVLWHREYCHIVVQTRDAVANAGGSQPTVAAGLGPSVPGITLLKGYLGDWSPRAWLRASAAARTASDIGSPNPTDRW
jgi:hypothetical protein